MVFKRKSIYHEIWEEHTLTPKYLVRTYLHKKKKRLDMLRNNKIGLHFCILLRGIV